MTFMIKVRNLLRRGWNWYLDGVKKSLKESRDLDQAHRGLWWGGHTPAGIPTQSSQAPEVHQSSSRTENK